MPLLLLGLREARYARGLASAKGKVGRRLKTARFQPFLFVEFETLLFIMFDQVLFAILADVNHFIICACARTKKFLTEIE